jgi:cytosine/adenosine deaminase-related metal-dependent hydrolase
VVEDGAVLQVDGTIVEIGRFADLAVKHSPDEVIGDADSLVLPGFVNAHHHVGLTPFQLGSPDLPLEKWIVRRMAARAVDLHLDTLYSAFQMVESGITAVQHMHGWVPGTLADVVRGSTAVVSAYERVGMRSSYSYLARDQCRLVYHDDAAFIATLPQELRADAEEFVRQRTLAISDIVALFEELHGARPKDGRIRIQLSPANLHWCSDALLGTVGDLSRKHGVPMHFHLLETPLQKAYAHRRTGGSAVAHLAGLGLLGPRMTLGHSVWVSEADLELMAATGSCVCHNCSSNFRLRSGIAPLHAFLARGLTVGLGIDEAGINDDRDMLQEMRLVRLAHRVPGTPEEVPSPSQIFHMATEASAATTPFAGEIGALEPGRAADLVVMDWRHIAEPYLEEGTPIVDALVYRARSQGVRTVIVGGECIYRDGRFTRIDKDEALAELKASLAAPPTESDRRRRRFAEALEPHAEAFYRSLPPESPARPFYLVNNRD